MSKVTEWVWRVGVLEGFGGCVFQIRPGTVKVRRITLIIQHPQTGQPGFAKAKFYSIVPGEPKDVEMDIPYHGALAVAESVAEHLDALWTPSRESGLKIITGGK